MPFGARHKNPRAAYLFSVLPIGDGAPRCHRLRGSGEGATLFHGLTPTAKCGRRIRGLLEPRAGARGIVLINPRPAAVLWFWGERLSVG